MAFVGRVRELEMLDSLWKREGVKTCLIYGRRRIGKSELIRQFCKGKRSIRFEFSIGSESSQLEYMADVLEEATGVKAGPFGTMYSCFKAIAGCCKEEETVVVFDEFQYLVSDDSGNAISSEVQRFIDTLLEGTGTMVILCGSHSSMMVELTSDPVRPLYGRFPNSIELKPLSLRESAEMHPGMPDLDVLKLYLTLGGIPAFHKEAAGSAYEDCLWNVFLREQAPLQKEVQLLIGTGSPQADQFRKVIRAVSEGSVTAKAVSERTGIEKRTCGNYLAKLTELGILGIRNPMYGAPKRPTYYVLDDAIAFYYGVYEANRARIDTERREDTMKSLAHSISTFLGMRFEEACARFVKSSYYCLDVGRWWGPSGEKDDSGRPVIVDIDVTARIEQSGAVYDLFAECKMRNRATGFRELNELMRRAEMTKANLNPRYMIFSTGGFDSDLEEYAEERRDVILVGLDAIMDRKPAKQLRSPGRHI